MSRICSLRQPMSRRQLARHSQSLGIVTMTNGAEILIVWFATFFLGGIAGYGLRSWISLMRRRRHRRPYFSRA
jgi:hypothetical protein